MAKKHILIILIIGLIILGGLVIYNNYNSQKQISIDGVNFTLPQGFQVSGTNSIGDITINNGTTSVFITSYNNPDIHFCINQYENATNNTIKITNRTINDTLIYKSEITNGKSGSNHYWFNCNNKTYSVYTWEETPNIDKIAFELINSAQSPQ